MRVAILGAQGQLGTALARVLTDDIVPLGRAELDIADAAAVERVLSDGAIEVVIHAAAYNLVDQAEKEPAAAFSVNAFGTRNVALLCAKRDIPLVYVSTDYVFGFDAARTTTYTENDLPGPVSAYGLSKLTGEYFVRSVCPKHFVVRTCGLYGKAQSGGKTNFVDKILKIGTERGQVSVVDDQWCTPTSVTDLATAIAALLRTDRYGLYHATNSGATTWCRFATEIFRLAKPDVKVQPTTSATFNAPARRPQYSVLDCNKLTETIGREMPPWQTALAEYVAEIV